MGGSSSKNEQKDKHAGPGFRTKVTSCDTKETIKKMEETGLRPPVGTDSEEGGEPMSPPGAGQAQPEDAGSSVKKGKKKEAKKKSDSEEGGEDASPPEGAAQAQGGAEAGALPEEMEEKKDEEKSAKEPFEDEKKSC